MSEQDKLKMALDAIGASKDQERAERIAKVLGLAWNGDSFQSTRWQAHFGLQDGRPTYFYSHL